VLSECGFKSADRVGAICRDVLSECGDEIAALKAPTVVGALQRAIAKRVSIEICFRSAAMKSPL
jgi:tRNA threonylcarbamoyladenosine modification (KEOPS) complex Cgi121 subunit